jgi:hypothetical protein
VDLVADVPQFMRALGMSAMQPPQPPAGLPPTPKKQKPNAPAPAPASTGASTRLHATLWALGSARRPKVEGPSLCWLPGSVHMPELQHP